MMRGMKVGVRRMEMMRRSEVKVAAAAAEVV